MWFSPLLSKTKKTVVPVLEDTMNGLSEYSHSDISIVVICMCQAYGVQINTWSLSTLTLGQFVS